MSGIKCEICGGSITMQADKTGLCKVCGIEYDIDAIRAMVGQKPNTTNIERTYTSNINKHDEIDRESLLVYLNDVRIMETLLHRSRKNENELIRRNAENENVVTSMQKKLEFQNQRIKELDSPLENNSDAQFIFKTGMILLIPSLIIFCIEALRPIGIFMLVCIGIAMICGVLVKICENLQMKMVQNSKQNQIELFRNEIDSTNQEVVSAENTYKKDKLEIDSLLLEIENEMNDINELLIKAYNANIIPLQFRNIEGVYYLYDYLSSSNQTLSEALMQANLETIKRKFDDMIQLQSVQIIQQAQINAKLGNLLTISEDIQNNSAIAAKYAQIVAVNTELNVKLTAEQLAYQRAEFWLN